MCDYFVDSNDSFFPKPSKSDEDKADCKLFIISLHICSEQLYLICCLCIYIESLTIVWRLKKVVFSVVYVLFSAHEYPQALSL